MNINGLLKQGGQMLRANAPEILTAVGITGVATTAYLAARGGIKATRKTASDAPYETLNRQEKIERIKKVAPCYAPAAVAGVVTVAAVVSSHKVSTQRIAVATTAASLATQQLHDYRAKVVQELGKKKDEALRASIAQDKVDKTVQKNGVPTAIIATGSALAFEEHTGRLFECDMEKLRKLEIKLNHMILSQRWVTLDDFYHEVGLRPTTTSCDWGWDQSSGPLEFVYSGVLIDDKPLISLGYSYLKPIP